jgi:adenylate kinase
MMGPPGAGKGTQAARLARQRGVPKISTGDMLRDGIRDRNPVALKAKALMDMGRLVDDRTMIAIVRERLSRPDTAHGFVLDGFPRTVSQAQALDSLVASNGNGPLVIVDVTVPEDELVRRLATRRICESCGTTAEPAVPGAAGCPGCSGTLVQRIDDDARVVTRAPRVYEESTRPVLEYYRNRPAFRVRERSPVARVRGAGARVGDRSGVGRAGVGSAGRRVGSRSRHMIVRRSQAEICQASPGQPAGGRRVGEAARDGGARRDDRRSSTRRPRPWCSRPGGTPAFKGITGTPPRCARR